MTADAASRLVVLATRRLATPGVLVAAAAAALFVAFGLDDSSALTETGGERAGVRRADAWWFLGGLAALVVTVRAAAVGASWRRADREWVGARAVTPLGYALATWTAHAGVGIAIGIAAWLGVESTADPSGVSERFVATLAAPVALLQDGGEALAFDLTDADRRLSPPRRLRVRLAATPGSGPSAAVRLTARRGATGEERTSEGLVSGRVRLALELPPGTGAVELHLERLGGGSGVALLPGAVALFEPARDSAAASPALAGRVALWLATAAALALGLGAWMGRATAAALALALQLPVVGGGALPALPGGDWSPSLALVADGLVPANPSAASLATSAVLIALGLALAAAGLRLEERTP